jgi:protein gp37
MKTMTKIEWCHYTCNCFWGCNKGCSYCQARSFAKRFGRRIGTSRGYAPDVIDKMANFKPVFLPDQLDMLDKIKKPSRIFMSFMGEPFSPEFKMDSTFGMAMDKIKQHPEHTIIMLTKCPENLPEEFPDNCWVGVSCTNFEMYGVAGIYLPHIKARVKFISFEPLLGSIIPSPKPYTGYNSEMMKQDLLYAGINWLIIGQKTPMSQKTTPKIEWIKNIVESANKADIAVFLKDNLGKLFIEDYRKTYIIFKEETLSNIDLFYPILEEEPNKRQLRQEFPIVK